MQTQNKMNEVQKVLEEISREYGDAVITHITDYEYGKLRVRIFLSHQYQYSYTTLQKWQDKLGAWLSSVSVVKNTLLITYRI